MKPGENYHFWQLIAKAAFLDDGSPRYNNFGCKRCGWIGDDFSWMFSNTLRHCPDCGYTAVLLKPVNKKEK